MSTRRQLYTPVRAGRCLTVVDEPATPPRATVCIVHGLTGDRSGPMDLLSRLASALCERERVRVVRFDLRGSGDSTGRFEHTTFAGMAEDCVDVLHATAAGDAPVLCAGISIGGVAATMAAHALWRGGEHKVAGVVLMSSDLIEGVRFGTAGVVPIRDGEFHLPETFFREREGIRPRRLLAETGLPFLFVHGAADRKVTEHAAWFADAGGRVVGVDSDHLFESSSARAALLSAWRAFLRDVLPPDVHDTKEPQP